MVGSRTGAVPNVNYIRSEIVEDFPIRASFAQQAPDASSPVSTALWVANYNLWLKISVSFGLQRRLFSPTLLCYPKTSSEPELLKNCFPPTARAAGSVVASREALPRR